MFFRHMLAFAFFYKQHLSEHEGYSTINIREKQSQTKKRYYKREDCQRTIKRYNLNT